MLLTKIKPAQFFGIEINSFAVKVLKVCFLLIELKMSGKLIDISVAVILLETRRLLGKKVKSN